MAASERHIDAAMGIVSTLKKKEDYDRARRVENGLDNAGRPILDNRDFLPLRSPDGTVWRVRVTNAGALTVTEEA